MNAIHTTQRALRTAKLERSRRRDLHGPLSASYRVKADEVRRLEIELRLLKIELAERQGLQVIGSAA